MVWSQVWVNTIDCLLAFQLPSVPGSVGRGECGAGRVGNAVPGRAGYFSFTWEWG